MFEGQYLYRDRGIEGENNIFSSQATFLYNTAKGTVYVVGSPHCGDTLDTCVVPFPFYEAPDMPVASSSYAPAQ